MLKTCKNLCPIISSNKISTQTFQTIDSKLNQKSQSPEFNTFILENICIIDRYLHFCCLYATDIKFFKILYNVMSIISQLGNR